ncbi:MAG: sigma factor, partial [Rubricoccaceae bacterium]|nr:sigma factor [Rubricoccaceae bacterium]
MSSTSPKESTRTPSASSEQDRELVKRALAGDQRAYRDLENKYRDALTRHVGKMVRQQGQVEDLVQEALIKAFGSLDSYSADYAFSTWVYK